MKGTPSSLPSPLTTVIRATDRWVGFMVERVPSLCNSASSWSEENDENMFLLLFAEQE